MFSVYTTKEEFKNVTTIWICVWKKFRLGKSRDYSDVIVFQKLGFQKVFRCPHQNAKPVFFNSTSLKSVFGEASFS